MVSAELGAKGMMSPALGLWQRLRLSQAQVINVGVIMLSSPGWCVCVCVPPSFIGVILMSMGEELFMEHEWLYQ